MVELSGSLWSRYMAQFRIFARPGTRRLSHNCRSGASRAISTFRTAPINSTKVGHLPRPTTVQAHPSTRDRVLAQLPFYAGIRIIETVRLDLDDIQLSARKGTLRVLRKGDKIREIPIHPQLRTDLHLWLHERPDWPEATRNPALLLNNRGGRLTTRGASGIFRQIADNAGPGRPN